MLAFSVDVPALGLETGRGALLTSARHAQLTGTSAVPNGTPLVGLHPTSSVAGSILPLTTNTVSTLFLYDS